MRSCFVAGPGQPPALLRLQPGRAAGARPRRRRGRPAPDLRLGRGRARRDRGRDHRRRPRRDHARASARRRRWSTTGSPTGSRPSGSPTGSTSSATRRPPTSSATSSASRRSSAFIDATIAEAEERGFVTTLMGRRRNIPELRSGNPQRRGLGERLAVNTVIQGTAADIIKVAMVRCHRALAEAGLETELVLQIHDELLFEGPGGGDGGGGGDRPDARWSPPSTSIRRSRSTSASGPTGWRRNRRVIRALRACFRARGGETAPP